MAVSANRLELLQIADAVAREKVIDRQIVIAAMEDAIQKAARSRYGSETDVRAEINPKTGEIRLQRLLQVVELVENPAIEVSLEVATDSMRNTRTASARSSTARSSASNMAMSSSIWAAAKASSGATS
jgi:hypothetical protein